LIEEKFLLKVPEEIADQARSAVERMLEVSQ